MDVNVISKVVTKREAVELLGLEKTGAVDYALPQQFADDFKLVTGVYPVNCFVWYYPHEGEGHIFGQPRPLTVEAKELLARYNKFRGTRYPIPEYPKIIEFEMEVYRG